MGVAALIDAGLEDRVTVKAVSWCLTPWWTWTAAATGHPAELLRRRPPAEPSVAGRVEGRPAVGGPSGAIDSGFYICWRPHRSIGGLARSNDEPGRRRPPRWWRCPYRRVISGVEIGENVWMDGIVVGKATDEVVEVRLVKASSSSLDWSRSARPRNCPSRTLAGPSSALARSAGPKGRGSPAGHRRPHHPDRSPAEDALFRGRDIKAAVSVGDDTTRIATSLLARLGVPVIGIVDGDEDGICMDSNAAEGSIHRAATGNDDQLGAWSARGSSGGRTRSSIRERRRADVQDQAPRRQQGPLPGALTIQGFRAFLRYPMSSSLVLCQDALSMSSYPTSARA